jgi:hypothetical protein
VQLAYQALHLGSHLVPGCVRIWETWAPLRVKLFLWLAVRRRHWTTDRRRRHGLDTHDNCLLCDQEPETIDHIVVKCSYFRQIWFGAAMAMGEQTHQPPPGPSWNGGTLGVRSGQGAAEKASTHSLRRSPGKYGKRGTPDAFVEPTLKYTRSRRGSSTKLISGCRQAPSTSVVFYSE